MFHPLLDKLSTLLQKMSSAVSTIGGIPRDIPAVRTAKRRRGSSRAERLFRSLAVVILAGSAIILSTVTFALSKDKEQNDFNTQVSIVVVSVSSWSQCADPHFPSSSLVAQSRWQKAFARISRAGCWRWTHLALR
jgi:hypothetical protein